MSGKWGLFDSVDELWMGNDSGPLSYGEENLARVAAQVCDARLAQRPGRTRARLLPSRDWRLRDEKRTKMTAEEAIDELESGRIP